MRDELLYEIQQDFPLCERPFDELAKRLGSNEDTVIQTLKEAKAEGIVRQTSAIFDTKRLGYTSSLVAFKVPEENIEKAAEAINAHPGVSHNYLRNHDFNIWFTLAVAPDSKLGLEKTVDILRKQSGAEQIAVLPTLKMFKIKVQMDTTGKKAKKEKVKKAAFKPIELTDTHIAVVKALQKDIELVSEPFKRACEETGLRYDELFATANELKEAGVMRRFAAILNHRRAGFKANAMSVWAVPDEIAEETGRRLAEFSAVSHCYLRPRNEHWPYNLFAMVHAKTQEECDNLIDEMAKETGLTKYGKLYSTREFKKRRLVYFDDAFAAWERTYGS
jgi:DNA-binding Lrp family transcriptional regulator